MTSGPECFGKSEILLDSQPKSVIKRCRQQDARASEGSTMSDREATNSDLIEIAKRNGDFRKNYGLLVGAFLYLRSINAARPRLFWWQAFVACLAGALGFWWRWS
jgi:hypothetical protein